VEAFDQSIISGSSLRGMRQRLILSRAASRSGQPVLPSSAVGIRSNIIIPNIRNMTVKGNLALLRIPTPLSPPRCATSSIPIYQQAYLLKTSRIRYRMRLCGRGSAGIVNILRTSLRIFLRLFGKNSANALEGVGNLS